MRQLVRCNEPYKYQREGTLDPAALNRDTGGIKLTYFTTTKRRTTTANSITFPVQLVIKWQDKKLPVSLLRFWVNNEAENQNFTSIKMTWSSELRRFKKRKSTAFFESR